jgi:2-dehydropantoate 2-reductase
VSFSDPQVQVTIVGTGAMACLFGARLSTTAAVTVTGSWNAGVEAVRAGGIRVVEASGSRPYPVAAVLWGEEAVPADLALILVKAWQTERVAGDLARLLKPGGMALTLQNGLGNIEILDGRARLGVTYMGATLIRPGHVQPGGAGTTWIAGADWVVRLFQNAGLAAEPADMHRLDGLLWGKLVVNCAINPVTAILGVRNGELLDRPDAMALMGLAAQECAEVARAQGIELPFPDPFERVCEVARDTAANQSSMLQDVLRGARTECDAINGAVVRWGEKLGIPTPANEMLVHLVEKIGCQVAGI